MQNEIHGSSSLTVDAKGRIVIPTEHREFLLGTGGGKLNIALHVADSCLTVHTLEHWQIVVKHLVDLKVKNAKSTNSEALQIRARAREILRIMQGSAKFIDVDANGRFLIPRELRRVANISKHAMLVAAGNSFELWSEDSWVDHWKQVRETESRQKETEFFQGFLDELHGDTIIEESHD